MNYTITSNPTYNSIEISFDDKPSQEVRNALKALKFRWHGVKKVWYGYTDEETARAAIDSKIDSKNTAETTSKTNDKHTTNKYGVKIGDIFSASWGYDQTNTDFFQVVSLAGNCSVRVREVYLPMISEDAVSGMSADRTYKLVQDILPPARSSVFIKDQEKGDLKRLKSYTADGVSNPQFVLDTFANAYLCTGDTLKTYESWYA